MSLWGKGIDVWNSLGAEPGHQLRNRIKAGSVVNLHGSFWIDRKHWESMQWWEQELVRTVAVGKQATSAVVVGRSAGVLWGLDVLGRGREVEVARRGGTAPQTRRLWPEGVRYRYTRFLKGDIIEAQGISMTNLERTIVDICRWEEFVAGLVAWESAWRNGRKLRDMSAWITALKGKHGIRHAQQALKYVDRRSESAGESFAKGLFIEAGFPMSRFQRNLTVELEGETFRFDFLYDNWLVIEFDGDIKYSGRYGDPDSVISRERAREKIIRNAGFDTLRVSWSDLVSRRLIPKFKAKLRERQRQIAKKTSP